ncbi:uncharacterized protein LOC144748322 [Ciona intestinalis]
MAPGFSFFKRLRTKSKSKRSVPSPSSFSTKDTVLSCTPSETSRFINDKYANGDAYGNAPMGNVKADLLGNESREQPQCVSKISPTISVNTGITSHEIMPDKITNLEIPSFWPSSVRLWFDTIERVFDSNQVFSECGRFTHAVSGLRLEQIDKVSHVVLNGDVDFPYSNLKSALLKFYEPNEVERLPKPFDVTQLNTHKPTEMSSEMKPSLSSHGDDCDVTENLLNKLCVDRLPEEVNHTLCLEYAQSDIETLACKADSIMMLNLPNSVSNLSSTIAVGSNAHETPSPTRISFQASVNDNLRIHQLIDERNSIKNASSQCVLPPVNLGFYTSDNAYQRGDVNLPPRNNAWRTRCFNQPSFCRRRKRRNRRFSPSQFCFYHAKYGYRAHKCIQPCSWHNDSRKRVKFSTCAVSRGNWTSYTPSTFNVFDNRLNLSFLCDSGSAVSIIPLWFFPRFSRRKSMRLQDVSGKTFSSFGKIKLVPNLNMGRSFVWTFQICDIEHAILGADFFNHYRILLDVFGKRLIPHHNFPHKRLASAKRTKRRKLRRRRQAHFFGTRNDNNGPSPFRKLPNESADSLVFRGKQKPVCKGAYGSNAVLSKPPDLTFACSRPVTVNKDVAHQIVTRDHPVAHHSNSLSASLKIKNSVVNGLSRVEVKTPSFPNDAIDLHELSRMQQNNDFLNDMKLYGSLQVVNRTLPNCNDVIVGDVSTGSFRPIIPPSLRRKVFNTLHSLSHPAIRASQKLIGDRFVWHGMRSDIRDWCVSCVCKRHVVKPCTSWLVSTRGY